MRLQTSICILRLWTNLHRQVVRSDETDGSPKTAGREHGKQSGGTLRTWHTPGVGKPSMKRTSSAPLAGHFRQEAAALSVCEACPAPSCAAALLALGLPRAGIPASAGARGSRRQDSRNSAGADLRRPHLLGFSLFHFNSAQDVPEEES